MATSWTDEILRSDGRPPVAASRAQIDASQAPGAARIVEFVVGRCRYSQSTLLEIGGDERVDVPTRAYLIESGNEKFIWDTGYARHFYTQTTGLYRLYRWVTPARLGSGQDLRVQLERGGISVRVLDAVIVSHFHADHVAGLADFTGLPVYATRAAWDSIDQVSGLRALRQGHIPALVPAAAHGDRRFVDSLETVALPDELRPFTAGWALSADRNVIVVELPGHARGHIGAFVRTTAGWELLAADAAWDARAFNGEKVRGPGALAKWLLDDPVAYRRSLERLQALHRNGIRIRLSHERGAVSRETER
ncbi:MAG: MBL fold metallo-hydrolase [Pseudomonadota bacterium]|nr:MBL fold metallo-hydrolase [Pseudomonadota bacterium]